MPVSQPPIIYHFSVPPSKSLRQKSTRAKAVGTTLRTRQGIQFQAFPASMRPHTGAGGVRAGIWPISSDSARKRGPSRRPFFGARFASAGLSGSGRLDVAGSRLRNRLCVRKSGVAGPRCRTPGRCGPAAASAAWRSPAINGCQGVFPLPGHTEISCVPSHRLIQS